MPCLLKNVIIYSLDLYKTSNLNWIFFKFFIVHTIKVCKVQNYFNPIDFRCMTKAFFIFFCVPQ